MVTPPRRNQPVCNDEQQKQMTQEFSECLNKYTKEHHESSGKAETPEQYQVSNNENYQFNRVWPSVTRYAICKAYNIKNLTQ